MIGYCESCKRERKFNQVDEYGVDVCVVCGTDLITGFYVEEDRYIVSAAEAEDIASAFLSQD